MKYTIKYSVFALALFVCLPNLSQAYTTTSQTSIRLNDNTLLFLVQYQFGHEKFSYHLPVMAKRGSEGSTHVGYNILKDGTLRTDVGATTAIVLSDAVMKGGSYLVEKGEAEVFTLVTFLTLPEGHSASSTQYALAVSALPFELATADNLYKQNGLSEAELKPYKTLLISTNQKIALTTHTPKI